jgi:hypothetical protein
VLAFETSNSIKLLGGFGSFARLLFIKTYERTLEAVWKRGLITLE